MSTFTATFIHFSTITAARRRHDNVGGTVERRIQIPVYEFTFDADDMNAARVIAERYLQGTPIVIADAVRVYLNADAEPLPAARAIAWNCLNNLYCRAAFDFAFRAANSIVAGTPNADADDVISSAACAFYDADAAAVIAADIADNAERAAAAARNDAERAAAEIAAAIERNATTPAAIAAITAPFFTDFDDARRADDAAERYINHIAAELNAAAADMNAGEFPEYFRRRAAYNAANTHVSKERAIKTTTARQDINDYFRAIDADNDADDDAAYFDSYSTPARVADDADDDARAAARIADDAARVNYVKERRARRRVIRKSFGVMTARQRTIVKAYAATGSMRIAADAVGLKNQSTVCRHMQAARARVADAGIVKLTFGTQDIGIRAADDADARRAACIDAARAVIDDYSRIDAAIAAAVAPVFGNDAADVPAAVAARVAAYDNAANWTCRNAERAAAERIADAERIAAEYAAARVAYSAECKTVEYAARVADDADIERAERNAARRRRPSNVPTFNVLTPKSAAAVRVAIIRNAAAERRAAAVVAAIAARADAERAARDTFDAARKSKDVITAERAAERYFDDMNAARAEYDAACCRADMRYEYETTTPAERAAAAERRAIADAARRRERAFKISDDMRNAAIAAEYDADARRRRERRLYIAAVFAVLNAAADAEFNAERRRADIAARADKNARARIAAARRDVAVAARADVPAARITMRSAIAARADISFMPRIMNGVERAARCVAADVASMNAERAAIAARRNAE